MHSFLFPIIMYRVRVVRAAVDLVTIVVHIGGVVTTMNVTKVFSIFKNITIRVTKAVFVFILLLFDYH